MKVCLSVNISTETCPTKFFCRFAQMTYSHLLGVEENEIQFEFPYIQVGNSIVDIARLRQLEHFINNSEAEWFINIDCDELWSKDAITKLVKNDADIVSAPVHYKNPPYTPNFFLYDRGLNQVMPVLEYINDKPFEVDGVGFGFIAIKRDAALQLYHHYGEKLFKSPRYNSWGNHVLGEDLSFCYRAKQLGLKIVVDPQVSVAHLSYSPIGRDDYHRALIESKEQIDNLIGWEKANA